MSARMVCWISLGLALMASCRRSPADHAARPAGGTVSSASEAAEVLRDKSPNLPVPAARKHELAETPPAVPAAHATDKAQAEDDLQSEEREANPTSETVTLTLTISPPVKALVMWGAKQLARVTPDNPTAELQRPRSSGPLDLDIRAEGFLPHHIRLYSDRNDKLNVRLVRPAEATGLLGYRNSPTATAAKGKTK